MSAIPRRDAGVRHLRLMDMDTLDDVLRVEDEAYPFPWTRGNFIDSLIANHLTWCVFNDRNELIAYAIAMPGVEELHLLNVTVAAAHRRRGHAVFLIEALIDHCRHNGARTLWLEVRPSNAAALALYARLGFARIGVRRHYYPNGGSRREDAWVMRLTVGDDPPRSERALA